MANRMTDTGKWKKGFVRGLKGPYKLLWFLLCDECDHAGIWDVDFEIAQIKVGSDMKITEQGALDAFKTKIIVFDAGRKWFIPSFIEFQYKKLSPKNRVHESVIQILQKYDLIDDNFMTKEAPSKPLISPLQGAIDKDKDKEKDKDSILKSKKESKKTEVVFPNVEFPEMYDSWVDVWGQWTEYKKSQHKEVYKTTQTEQVALNNLVGLSEGNPAEAEKIVQQSIANLWKGFFKLKNSLNGSGTISSGTLFNQQPKLGTSAARIEALKRW